MSVPVAALRRTMQGDIDAADDTFTEDVTFRDRTTGDELEGIDEVREVWAEMAGRRGVAEVELVTLSGDSAVVRFSLYFRADSHQYAQRGTAQVRVRDGLIHDWSSAWVESEEDLAAWEGD